MVERKIKATLLIIAPLLFMLPTFAQATPYVQVFYDKDLVYQTMWGYPDTLYYYFLNKSYVSNDSVRFIVIKQIMYEYPNGTLTVKFENYPETLYYPKAALNVTFDQFRLVDVYKNYNTAAYLFIRGNESICWIDPLIKYNYLQNGTWKSIWYFQPIGPFYNCKKVTFYTDITRWLPLNMTIVVYAVAIHHNLKTTNPNVTFVVMVYDVIHRHFEIYENTTSELNYPALTDELIYWFTPIVRLDYWGGKGHVLVAFVPSIKASKSWYDVPIVRLDIDLDTTSWNKKWYIFNDGESCDLYSHYNKPCYYIHFGSMQIYTYNTTYGTAGHWEVADVWPTKTYYYSNMIIPYDYFYDELEEIVDKSQNIIYYPLSSMILLPFGNSTTVVMTYPETSNEELGKGPFNDVFDKIKRTIVTLPINILDLLYNTSYSGPLNITVINPIPNVPWLIPSEHGLYYISPDYLLENGIYPLFIFGRYHTHYWTMIDKVRNITHYYWPRELNIKLLLLYPTLVGNITDLTIVKEDGTICWAGGLPLHGAYQVLGGYHPLTCNLTDGDKITATINIDFGNKTISLNDTAIVEHRIINITYKIYRSGSDVCVAINITKPPFSKWSLMWYSGNSVANIGVGFYDENMSYVGGREIAITPSDLNYNPDTPYAVKQVCISVPEHKVKYVDLHIWVEGSSDTHNIIHTYDALEPFTENLPPVVVNVTLSGYPEGTWNYTWGAITDPHYKYKEIVVYTDLGAQYVNVTVVAYDPDGDPLTYTYYLKETKTFTVVDTIKTTNNSILYPISKLNVTNEYKYYFVIKVCDPYDNCVQNVTGDIYVSDRPPKLYNASINISGTKFYKTPANVTVYGYIKYQGGTWVRTWIWCEVYNATNTLIDSKWTARWAVEKEGEWYPNLTLTLYNYDNYTIRCRIGIYDPAVIYYTEKEYNVTVQPNNPPVIENVTIEQLYTTPLGPVLFYDVTNNTIKVKWNVSDPEGHKVFCNLKLYKAEPNYVLVKEAYNITDKEYAFNISDVENKTGLWDIHIDCCDELGACSSAETGKFYVEFKPYIKEAKINIYPPQIPSKQNVTVNVTILAVYPVVYNGTAYVTSPNATLYYELRIVNLNVTPIKNETIKIPVTVNNITDDKYYYYYNISTTIEVEPDTEIELLVVPSDYYTDYTNKTVVYIYKTKIRKYLPPVGGGGAPAPPPAKPKAKPPANVTAKPPVARAIAVPKYWIWGLITLIVLLILLFLYYRRKK